MVCKDKDIFIVQFLKLAGIDLSVFLYLKYSV